MKHVPFQRALFYLLLVCLLPALFVFAHWMRQKNSLNEVKEKLNQLTDFAMVREKRQAPNLAAIHTYRDADHFYIDKQLESITLLEPEIDALQKIVSSKYFTDDEAIRRRLEFLTGSGNSLRFSEGVVHTFPQFQETTETLIHPVEINSADLQKILSLIEGVPIGPYKPAPKRPQMVILDFKLERKAVMDQNEVFLLNMKLLKREFL